ncbi:mpv17-like protein 2 isoform X2 [Petromyzon marinus]|uniref:mpv17-like protein 2 isoform X2 n=1 Tax=Petromyzon marinus TaxID=7757 RepID=UPI003F6EBCF7
MLRQVGSLVPRLLRGRGLLVANTASCGALMATGDAVQQWRERRAGSREHRDWVRTARMFSVGIVMGPILHLWYVYLDKFLPERTRKVVAKKILADQLIASPPLAALFFFGMGALEGQSVKHSAHEFADKFLEMYMDDKTDAGGAPAERDAGERREAPHAAASPAAAELCPERPPLAEAAVPSLRREV